MSPHELSPGPLVAGALFILVGALFLVAQGDSFLLQLRWVWPIVLIGLGVAGLLDRHPSRRETKE